LFFFLSHFFNGGGTGLLNIVVGKWFVERLMEWFIKRFVELFSKLFVELSEVSLGWPVFERFLLERRFALKWALLLKLG
jgi:hypothetical protein